MRVAGALSLGVGAFVLLGWVNRGAGSLANPKGDGGGFGPQEVWRTEASLGVSPKVEKSPGQYAPMLNLGMDLKSPPPPPPPEAPKSAQMLIRSGSLSLEVAQFEQAAQELGRIAREAGGYVADTRQERRPSGTTRGEITLRIPADRYDGTGGAVKRLGKVLNEASEIQDVTRAYQDVEAKLGVRTEASRRAPWRPCSASWW